MFFLIGMIQKDAIGAVMKKCLIVDDSHVVRKIARKIVEELQFSAAEAEDGCIALDRCRGDMSDAILLDWNMSNMDELEFLEKLRALSGVVQPIVVFCTTENALSHIQKALEYGADEYIMKPFDSDIVREKFKEVGLVD